MFFVVSVFRPLLRNAAIFCFIDKAVIIKLTKDTRQRVWRAKDYRGMGSEREGVKELYFV